MARTRSPTGMVEISASQGSRRVSPSGPTTSTASTRPPSCSTRTTRVLQVGVHAAGRRQVPAPLPHHAGAETRVVEAFDEAGDHLAAERPRCRATHS